MAKGATFDNDFLKLIFNATNISLLADNTATTPLASLYVSLHTADPTAAGNQQSSEVGYTNYARAAVARTAGGFTVTTNSVAPAANVPFPLGGVGTAPTATNFAIGTAPSGTGKILWTGTITPNIVCGNGVTPILTSATTVTES